MKKDYWSHVKSPYNFTCKVCKKPMKFSRLNNFSTHVKCRKRVGR